MDEIKANQLRYFMIQEEIKMRKEYDFSNAEPNLYFKKLRKQISIQIDMDTIEYFKKQAEKTGIAYQNLINLSVPLFLTNRRLSYLRLYSISTQLYTRPLTRAPFFVCAWHHAFPPKIILVFYIFHISISS
jgi:predicted DNA binding CopG/RHH family protein